MSVVMREERLPRGGGLAGLHFRRSSSFFNINHETASPSWILSPVSEEFEYPPGSVRVSRARDTRTRVPSRISTCLEDRGHEDLRPKTLPQAIRKLMKKHDKRTGLECL